jgi:hypothetical protein
MGNPTELETQLAEKQNELKEKVELIKSETKSRIKKIKEDGKKKKVDGIKIKAKAFEALNEANVLIKEVEKEYSTELNDLQSKIDEGKVPTGSEEKRVGIQGAGEGNETVTATTSPEVSNLLKEVKELEDGEYIGLINKSLQSRDSKVLNDFQNLLTKLLNREAKLEEEGACAKVFNGKTFVRSYSLKEHGKDYKEMAKKYISNNKLTDHTIEEQD